MPPELEKLEKDLEKGESTINLLKLLTPTHRFYLLVALIIAGLIIIIYFMYINQANPEIQKGILGLLVGAAGGGVGGYVGAKKA